MVSFLLVSSTLFSLFILLVSARIYLQIIRISKIPPEIPWAGVSSNTTFAKLRACFGEVFAGRKRIKEGYEKYGRHGLPFVLPAMQWPGIALPPSNAQWVAAQPEAVLSHVKPFNDMAGFDYLAHGPSVDSVHDFTVIRQSLTRQMRVLVPQSLDEIGATFDEHLGMDCDGWKEVKISDIIQKVSFRATNRIFVGLALCRNKKYLAAIEHWSLVMGVTSLIMRAFIPFPWKKWIAPVLTVPASLFQYRIQRFILPAIHERLARFDERLRSPSQKRARDESNDMMQWIIETNAMKPDPAELNPSNIAGKMILLNVFAVNTTSAVASMLLLDLLNHPSSTQLLAELQAEADRVLPTVASDPKVLLTMVKTDSAIREILRYNPFLAQGMVREIMPPQGITTPDGLHLPQGCHTHTIVSSMQRDEDIFPGANNFEPLRHYEAADQTGKQRTAVQLDGKFLTFSLGRHACPGRFFAVHSLKLIVGYLLWNYDIEAVPNSPGPFREIGEGVIPSPKALIRCRRRRRPASES